MHSTKSRKHTQKTMAFWIETLYTYQQNQRKEREKSKKTRSLAPKDWDTEHEVAWNWLWENIERVLKAGGFWSFGVSGFAEEVA